MYQNSPMTSWHPGAGLCHLRSSGLDFQIPPLTGIASETAAAGSQAVEQSRRPLDIARVFRWRV